ELYASRIGHHDAESLRGSTPHLPNPSPLSNSWDAFISFSQWFFPMLTRFSLGCQRQKRRKKNPRGSPGADFHSH
ncbi:hypothetical protein ACJ8QD_23570, partial [Serratia sp. CY76356]|uniref:hypothetical protein n=1 Tax=Serratia sp. CY76356 TaxID=3383680 RepID=UPI003FA128C2